MKFEFAIPSSTLQPYIKQYWAIENVLDKEHEQRIIATGLPELTFYFGNRPTSKQRNIEGNILLNGQQNNHYDLLIKDRLSMFSVTFQPNGLSHFLKMPISELQNQTVSVENLGKIFMPHLEEQLFEAITFKERIGLIEAFFIGLLKKSTISVDHKRMKQSIELISKGKTNIEILASNVCLSRKQFERIFLAHIGISPKQFLKIVRFQNAIFIKQNSKTKSLTDLAYEAAYYDQSHFINETKELTGHSPKKLFESGEIVSDFFS